LSITQRLGLFCFVCVTSFCLLIASQLLPSHALAAPSLPASCQDIKSVHPTASDGTYTIYSNGIGYEVFCHDMDAEPMEYITVAVSGVGSNYSTSNRDGILIETYFSKLRINPLNLMVITNDYTFAENSAAVEGNAKVPYGEGHSCSWDYGRANIDLRGTAFAVIPDQFVVDGWDTNGNAEYSVDNQVVNMWVNGWCGFIAPYGSGEGEGGEILQLQLYEGTGEPGESEEPGEYCRETIISMMLI
jgi:hypothetical protein